MRGCSRAFGKSEVPALPRIGDGYPAGIGQSLDPRRDVDAAALDQRSSPSTITAPRMMAMRSSMRLAAATPASCSGIDCCTSTAQRTTSTTLANSTSRPSPVVLTMRPWCSAIFGSTSSRRSALRGSSVPSSSAPISREYRATSAARIAASRRTAGISHPVRQSSPTEFTPKFTKVGSAVCGSSSQIRLLWKSPAGRKAHGAMKDRFWSRPCENRTPRQITKYQAWRRVVSQIIVSEPAV